MGRSEFVPEVFFDLSLFPFAKVFDGVVYVWDVLPKLSKFIASSFKENVTVGEGTIVEEGAFIKGPAIIGKNCLISHGAYLRENCIIGDGVTIGHACEIKNSIILNKTAVAHLSYIGDSVVGGNVNVGGGVICANFRFDEKPIVVRIGKTKIDTKLQKFGAIIGDGTKIGVNTALNPGTILGKNCIVFPQTSALGVHKEGKIIK